MGNVGGPGRSLILITGEEGVGKSTVMAALLPHTPGGAKLDAEDVGQVQPFVYGPAFLDLIRSNVLAVIGNFWNAGYVTVITGSLLDGDTYASFDRFRKLLPADVAVYVICLSASKAVRDRRRIKRAKPSTKEWRDRVDASYPREDTSLADNATDYRYLAIDNSTHRPIDTISAIRAAIPEIYPPD